MRAPAILCLVALAGCTAEFDDPSEIKDLRVLAIGADTPEVVIESGADGFLDEVDVAALPETLPEVRLSALVVDPHGAGREVTFTVVACPPTGGGTDRGRDRGPAGARDSITRAPCPTGAEMVAQGRAAPPAGDIVVPVQVTYAVPRRFLEAALTSDRQGRVFGWPVTLSFTFQAGAETVVAIKRLLVSPRVSPEQTPNQNPQVTAVSHRLRREDPKNPIDLADRWLAAPTVPLGGKVLLEPERGDTEPYWTRVFRPEERRLDVERVERETLRYAFFATRGTFAPDDVSTEPSPLLKRPPEGLVSTYTAPRDLLPGESDLVDVWIVVRDERGGAGVARLGLRLVR